MSPIMCKVCRHGADTVNALGVCPDCEMDQQQSAAKVQAEEQASLVVPQKQIATRNEKGEIFVEEKGISLKNFSDLWRFSEALVKSGLTPSQNPAEVMMQVQAGLELGISPMVAARQMPVINRRIFLMGDLALALCRRSGLVKSYREGVRGEGDERVGWAETERRDTGEIFREEFSVQQAQVAGVWGKRGRDGQPTPWVTHPHRMLRMRARGYLLRDAYPEVLFGMDIAEPEVEGRRPGPRAPQPSDAPDPIFEA